MRKRLAVPALVATLMVPLAPTPAASAPTAPATPAGAERITADVVGYIAFSESRYATGARAGKNSQGPGDLRVIAGDGSLGINLTEGPANDIEPAFSPDSTEVAFSSDRANRRAGVTDLYVINVYTAEVRRLTYGAGTGAVSWSRDGKNLVVDDRKGLLVVPAAGGSAKRLVRTPKGFEDSSPSWAADGTEVVFTRAKVKNDRTVSSAIWSIGVDGSEERRLVGGSGAQKFATQPTVAPDGFTMAWVTREATGTTIWLGELYYGLLDNVRKFVSDRTHQFDAPAFAPDTSALVVTRLRGNAKHGAELVTFDLKDAKQRLLVSVRRGTLTAPTWAD
ncbi:hypothetical protein GCM10009547_45890 [Sporichthya brevicatena]|uniref:Uncharacterized protein n=1 Tax=Sporichthya brevicatena TaxID=171442 RepID=A0ABN1HC90_9ACTN